MRENFYRKTIKETAKILRTDLQKGLSSQEVKIRQKKFGPNKLPRKKKTTGLILFLRQFNNLFTYILLIAAIISFLLSHFTDAWVILAIVLLNAIIGFIQEAKAEKTINALQKMVVVFAKVLRNGEISMVNSEELVPGDIVLLDAGDKIPADLRLVKVMDFQTNEAPLTGESTPIAKTTGVLNKKTPLAERKNMAFMGTVAVAGKAKGIVVGCGLNTELGQISELVVEVKEEPTPLQLRLKKLSMQIAFAIFCLCLLVIVGGIIADKNPGEMFIYGVAIAVGAIPEGLIVVLTVILVLGMARILKRKALVRTLLAAETLGSTTVICTDKTGTITTGKMKAEKVETVSKSFSFPNIDKTNLELKQTLKVGMLCNDLHFKSTEGPPKRWKIIGDPTEKALVVAGGLIGLRKEELEKDLIQIKEIPFDSYLKYMATAYEDKDNQRIKIFIKGATERLLERANYIYKDGQIENLTPKDKEKFLKINEQLSGKTYRVISCAFKEVEISEKEFDLNKEIESGLVFTGVIGIRDPIRSEVKEALKVCKEAGINIKMITGDHKLTARAIAKEIGFQIKSDEEILSGEEMDTMTPEELEARIPKVKIFARVAPKHKILIVDALQRQKEVVAMTGDGVNDAPALKSADIGVAMGTGTEVAKEASDMILLDNNLRTIEAAVEEGRAIFENIRKAVLFLLSGSFTELILVSGSLLLDLPLPILPTQILWVNLIEDGLPGFALAFEKGEKEVMKDRPRKLKEPILNQEIKAIIFLISFLTSFILFGLFFWMWKTTGNLALTRSFVFVGLGIDSLFYIFSCRSLRKTIFKKNIFSNKFLIFAVIIGLFLFIIALYVPFFQNILKTEPLGMKEWIILIGFGIFNVLLIEITKWIFIKKDNLDKNASYSA